MEANTWLDKLKYHLKHSSNLLWSIGSSSVSRKNQNTKTSNPSQQPCMYTDSSLFKNQVLKKLWAFFYKTRFSQIASFLVVNELTSHFNKTKTFIILVRVEKCWTALWSQTSNCKIWKIKISLSKSFFENLHIFNCMDIVHLFSDILFQKRLMMALQSLFFSLDHYRTTTHTRTHL